MEHVAAAGSHLDTESERSIEVFNTEHWLIVVKVKRTVDRSKCLRCIFRFSDRSALHCHPTSPADGAQILIDVAGRWRSNVN